MKINYLINKLLKEEELENSMVMYMNNSVKNPINISSLDIQDIIGIVCQITKIPANKVTHKTREREIVETRHFIFYFARRLTNFSLKSIGKEFNRDHTTVIHGVDNVRDFITSPGYDQQQAIHAMLCEVFNMNIAEDIEKARMQEKRTPTYADLTQWKKRKAELRIVPQPTVFQRPAFVREKADHTNTNWQTKYAEA